MKQRGGIVGDLLPWIIGAALLFGAATAIYQYIDNNWATDAGVAKGRKEVQAQWDEAKLQQKEEEIERGRNAAHNLGEDRAKSEVVHRTVTKYIDRIVDRPVYRNMCMDDDGLRNLNCAIRGETGTAACRPDAALPASGGTDGQGRSDSNTLDSLRR